MAKSDQDHNSDDRDVTNSLIEHSETVKYTSEGRKPKVTVTEWADAVVGWKSYGQPIKTSNILNTGTNVKKKRTVERAFTDLNYVNAYTNQTDDYWSNNSHPSEFKAIVRCVGDEVETYPIPPWKSNIEQGTYRYIPDNGSYRTLKFMYDERRDWYTIRKKYPEKVSTTWHQNCKRVQREMRRQLKRELTQLSRTEKEKENSGLTTSGHNSSKTSTCDPTSGGETTRSNSELRGVIESQRERVKVDTRFSNQIHLKPELVHDRLKVRSSENNTRPKKEIRVKSTHSDGAVSQIRKMKTIHERESEPPTPMPQYSIPSGSQMLKSASDLFIENFSSRISALEDEIKKDSKWLRKNENELNKLQNSRAKYREHTRANFKDNGTTNSTPRQPVKTETLGCDIFSVKPMAHKELNPLEKTRSYSKSSDHSDYSNRENNSPFKNRPNFNTQQTGINGYNGDTEIGLNGYNSSSVDNSQQAMFNTLTGTKINTQNNKKTSKGFSGPATITICDNNHTQTNNSNQNNRHGEPYRQIPVMIDKKIERKESVTNVPALLPEISGKRLEMK